MSTSRYRKRQKMAAHFEPSPTTRVFRNARRAFRALAQAADGAAVAFRRAFSGEAL